MMTFPHIANKHDKVSITSAKEHLANKFYQGRKPSFISDSLANFLWSSHFQSEETMNALKTLLKVILSIEEREVEG